MAFSRRVFLSLLGFVPFLAARSARAAAARAEASGDIVVYRGWVLRREDLAQLPRQ